jgi:hypothetical protein
MEVTRLRKSCGEREIELPDLRKVEVWKNIRDFKHWWAAVSNLQIHLHIAIQHA